LLLLLLHLTLPSCVLQQHCHPQQQQQQQQQKQ
jgi:hypothetical protein